MGVCVAVADEEVEPGRDAGLEQTIEGFLAAHSVATLAVTDAHGPWAAAVFFVNERFDLYFVTSADTRHGAALAADPRCGATVQEQPSTLAAIRGVQLTGRATIASDGEARISDLYVAKFPFVRDLYQPDERTFVIAGKRLAWPFWRLQSSDVYWVDNRTGFGRRRHLRLR